MTDPRQEKITDAVLMFLAGNLLPFHVIESAEFHDLLKLADPRYTVRSQKHLSTKLLQEKTRSMEENVKEQLRQAQSVALSIDLWSNAQMRRFIGITGHYILDWAMKSVVLACKRLHGRHTSDNIFQHYEETIATFEVAEKILTIVTDNASNMVKAFQILGFLFRRYQ